MNAQQRARLLAAQAERLRRARLSHYREQARIAQAPDYFARMARLSGLPRTAQTFHIPRREVMP